MCYERWMQRRQEEAAQEGREMWRDFDRSRPIVEDDPPPDEPVRFELHDEPVPATTDR
jgi:hypothetical protein